MLVMPERWATVWVLVDVERANGQTPRIRGGDLLNHRSHKTARTTPGGPKVDQHWTGGLEDIVFEIAGRDRCWCYHTCFLLCLGCDTRTTAGTRQA